MSANMNLQENTLNPNKSATQTAKQDDLTQSNSDQRDLTIPASLYISLNEAQKANQSFTLQFDSKMKQDNATPGTTSSEATSNVATDTQQPVKKSIADKQAQSGFTPAPQTQVLYYVAPGTRVYVAPGAGHYTSGTNVFLEQNAVILEKNTNNKIDKDLPPNTLVDVANGTPILLWNGSPAEDSTTKKDAVVTGTVYAYELPKKQQLQAHYSNYTPATQQSDSTWLDIWLATSYVDSCHSCYRSGCHGYCGYYRSNHHHHYHTWHHHHHCNPYGHGSLVDILLGNNHHHHGHIAPVTPEIRHQRARAEAECCKSLFNCIGDVFCCMFDAAKCCCGACAKCVPSCLEKTANGCGTVCNTLVDCTPKCLETTVNACGSACNGCNNCCTSLVQAAPDCRVADFGKCCDICGEVCTCVCEVLECLTKCGPK